MRLKHVSLVAALVLGGLMACTLPGNAQEAKQGKKGRMTVEQRVERMSTELNLTSDQKPKVTKVLEAMGKKRQEIMQDSSLSREQKREKMQEMMKDENKEMKKILTSEQYTKYEDYMKQMRQNYGKKGEGKKKSE